MKFTKMHGIGNDYVYVDCTKKDLAHTSETVSYTHLSQEGATDG